jgi:prophage regulatory protein
VTTNPPPLVVDRDAAAAALAVSVRTFEAMVARGDAPKPRKVSAGRVGWLWRELVEFAESRPVSDHRPGPGQQDHPRSACEKG